MRRRVLAVLAVLVVAAGVAGVSGAFSGGQGAAVSRSPMHMPMASASPAARAPASYEMHRALVHVKIVNFAFQPSHLVVSPGTRVVWTNEDSDPHTVTTDRPGFSSQALDTGSSYTQVASRAGTFAYHCTIHPLMHGTLVVEG